MTHITIEREEAKRILHVINSGAGELRQLGLRLAGKTLEQALAAPVQEPLGKLCVFDDADSEFGWSYDISGNAEQHRRLKELDGAMLYTAQPAAQPAPVQPVAWVGLERSDMPDGEDPMFDHPYFIKGMVYAANKLVEKNNASEKGQS